ncbi:MAG: IS91 family transposase [Caldilineaceae bacterium]
MVTLAEIFRQYGPAYRAAYQDELLPSHLRVMWCIKNCGSPLGAEALGGHVYQCEACGEIVYSYHSCRNRHCNQCQTDKAAAWLAAQQILLLPVPYFLVTFTLPEELRPVAFGHQQTVYNLLFRAAAEALQALAADPRFVGGQIGMVGVLHTWTRDLRFHPHVHFLVPAGDLDFVNDRWLPVHNHFFVRVEPLAILFCAKFRDGLKQAGLYSQAPANSWRQPWVVHSKPVGYGARAVEYLADYVFRVGISNSRIVNLENDAVIFWYQENKTKRHVYVTLPVFQFMRRFLQHVLPQGFVKVRYYGFYAAGQRHRLALARELLAADPRQSPAEQTAASASLTLNANETVRPCPKCGQSMHCVQLIRPCSRCPP